MGSDNQAGKAGAGDITIKEKACKMMANALQSVRIDLAVEKAIILNCSSAQIISGTMTGDSIMKQIDISTTKYPNTFALVDDKDYAKVNQFKWHAAPNKIGDFYVARRERGSDKMIRLSRYLLCAPKGTEVDHENCNGLDNQRHNLRFCTRSQNMGNARKPKTNTSGYKGVTWDKWVNKWKAQTKKDGKHIAIGRFFCLIAAAKAYDKKARELFGEFARVNFPIIIPKPKEGGG